MKRRIIKIDSEKCNGCGLCAVACHEGAIGMVDGKARLLRDDYCDGLGDCLPVCEANAISFEEREALAYDEAAVKANMKKSGCPSTHARTINRDGHLGGTSKDSHQATESPSTLACGCPSTHAKEIRREQSHSFSAHTPDPISGSTYAQGGGYIGNDFMTSKLSQWPVQIKLVPPNAPYFDGANLLIAADCTAYAYAAFHERFIKNHITLIGCPKLDMVEYVEKLTDILKNNNIKSVRIVRMEVPCCGGIESAAITALKNSNKFIPWQVYTISTDGRIIE